MQCKRTKKKEGEEQDTQTKAKTAYKKKKRKFQRKRHNIQQEIPRQIVNGKVHEQEYGKTWKSLWKIYAAIIWKSI